MGVLGLVLALVAIGLSVYESNSQNHKINELKAQLSQTQQALGVSSGSGQQTLADQQQQGADAGIKSDLRNAATAEETYLTDYDTYATSIDQLLSEGFKFSSASDYQDENQQIDIAANGNQSYCLSATASSGTTWYYDSLNGGIQPPGVTC